MVFKTNYNQQRAERDRAKRAKKEAKDRERQEEAARRKAGLAPADDAQVVEPAGESPATAPIEGST
jgi:hypothetical protein